MEKVDTKGYQYSDKLIVEKNADPKIVVGLRKRSFSNKSQRVFALDKS